MSVWGVEFILLHVIDCSQNNLIESYQKIRNEIIQYGKNLAEKFEIIAISKSDLCKKNNKELQKSIQSTTGKNPLIFSCHTRNGIDILIDELLNNCNQI